MNILFLLISYPDVANNTNMYTDLTEEFRRNNHNVYVVSSCFSNGEKLKNEGNIVVLRVKTGRLFNVNPIIKGLSNLKLPYQFAKSIAKYFDKIKFPLLLNYYYFDNSHLLQHRFE